MRTLLPGLLALVVLAAASFIHGPWSGREATSVLLEAKAGVLDRIPLTIGDEWTSEARPIDAETLRLGEIVGYTSRTYKNRRGQVVSVLLVCGRPGPIAVHSPEVCYGGSGFEAAQPKPEPFSLSSGADGTPDTFWVNVFKRTTPTRVDLLRILYSWNAEGSWVASTHPRVDWASRPFLYKLYVVRPVAATDEPLDDNDPSVSLLRALLPQLRSVLFPPPDH